MKHPDRIWASEPQPTSSCIVSFTTPSERYDTEYVRADLAPAWRPIATAPKDGSDFLGFLDDWQFVVSFDRGSKVFTLDDGQVVCPTYWMPLPPKPEGAA